MYESNWTRDNKWVFNLAENLDDPLVGLAFARLCSHTELDRLSIDLGNTLPILACPRFYMTICEKGRW